MVIVWAQIGPSVIKQRERDEAQWRWCSGRYCGSGDSVECLHYSVHHNGEYASPPIGSSYVPHTLADVYSEPVYVGTLDTSPDASNPLDVAFENLLEDSRALRHVDELITAEIKPLSPAEPVIRHPQTEAGFDFDRVFNASNLGWSCDLVARAEGLLTDASSLIDTYLSIPVAHGFSFYIPNVLPEAPNRDFSRTAQTPTVTEPVTVADESRPSSSLSIAVVQPPEHYCTTGRPRTPSSAPEWRQCTSAGHQVALPYAHLG